jgi:hypothetical protein
MAEIIARAGDSRQNAQLHFERELAALRLPGALTTRLAEIDRVRRFRRLYVMGCGRSGTWLLTGFLSTFVGIDIVQREVPMEAFGVLTTRKSVLLLKRNDTAYQRIGEVPESIEIVYILRHPYDVLTSHNPNTGKVYHIGPERWTGEIESLRYIVQSGRNNTTIIRYEDLVRNPEKTQAYLSKTLNLSIRSSARDIAHTFRATPRVAKSMQGVRSIDTNSVDRYKTDAAKIEYLRALRPRLLPMLRWVAKRFDYDIALEELPPRLPTKRL